MDNEKDNEYYVRRIKLDSEFIVKQMETVSIDDLRANEVLLDSMMFRMIQISENAKNLTDDYKERYSEIPWYSLHGMRNRIVHDYGKVDLCIVYDTLKEDIPDLLRKIQGILN